MPAEPLHITLSSRKGYISILPDRVSQLAVKKSEVVEK